MTDKKTILIVEDDSGLSEMLSTYFQEHSFLVEAASSGEDALRWLVDGTPDIILLDIHLPGINGYELCRRLRDMSRHKHTPVIFLTERREKDDRLAGLELGAADYITKPFDVQELGLRVNNTVQRAGRRSQASPITGLPERTTTRERLTLMFEQPEWGIVLVAISGLNRFADDHGFMAADDVARAAAMIIQKVVEETGGSDFLGHMDAVDFVIITSPKRTRSLADLCRQRLDSAIPYFYPATEWQALEKSPSKERLILHVAGSTSLDRPATSFDELRQALLNSDI